MDLQGTHKTTYKQRLALLAAAVILTLIILELGLRLAGGVFLFQKQFNNKVFSKADSAVNILCIGESTTGYGGDQSYPSQLEQILNREVSSRNFNVINEGIIGGNTSVILHNLKRDIQKYKPDMVVSMIGINDEHYHIGKMLSQENRFSFIYQLRTVKLFSLLWDHLEHKFWERSLLKKGRYVELGTYYMNSHMYDKADEMFEKAIDNDPTSSLAYYKMGLLDRIRGDFSAKAFEQAITLDPLNFDVLLELGWRYIETHSLEEGKIILEEAIKLNPHSGRAYLLLSIAYKRLNDNEMATQMLNKSLDYDVKSFALHYFNQKLYDISHDDKKAEKKLKETINHNPCDSFSSLSLMGLYREQGNHEAVKNYQAQSENNKKNCYSTITKENYLNIKKEVEKAGIALIAVQYPTKDVSLLKFMLNNDREIIYVDNEKIFLDELKRKKYSQLFIDRFAGTFGHATDYGNYLLAQNVAKAIMKFYNLDQ